MALLTLLPATPAAAQVARTDAGPVRGHAEAGHIVFRGIPFAAPPLGARRWRPPAPPERRQGVLDATRPAASCPQADYGWNRADHLAQDEDCLTLDIGTERLSGRRPVLVLIHGGSNTAGSAGDSVLTPMVHRGVVVVAIRYRLDAPGFMLHRSIPGGSRGLQDQLAALRWIRGTIANFGGDPDRVTIAGESAGAQDVGLLIAAPAARGLFRRAIMESGTPGFGLPLRSREEALRLGDQLDTMLGTGGDPARLRAVAPWPVIQAAQRLHDPVVDTSYRWLRATVDGDVLPDTPDRLLAQAPPVDVLIGSNRVELDLPGGRARRDDFIATAYGPNEAAARAFYRLDDRPDPAPDPRLGTRDQQIATDATFRCPAQRMATAMAGRGGRVWAYEFDEDPAGPRTTHAAELPYVFGERRLGALHLMDYWTNFVLTGDPNGGTLPRWPGWDVDGRHLALDATGARPAAGSRTDICRLGSYL